MCLHWGPGRAVELTGGGGRDTARQSAGRWGGGYICELLRKRKVPFYPSLLRISCSFCMYAGTRNLAKEYPVPGIQYPVLSIAADSHATVQNSLTAVADLIKVAPAMSLVV